MASNGDVFVSDSANHRIQQFTNAGMFVRAFGWGVADSMPMFEMCALSCKAGLAGDGDGQFNIPAGIAVDGSGNVFVADSHNSRVEKFAADGTFITAWGSSGNGNGQFSNGTIGVAVDTSGNVFVGDPGNSRVQKFSNDGTFITAWGSFVPGDMAVDTNGNVFIVDSGNMVETFNNNGGFIKSWTVALGFLNIPIGIATDGHANVLVSTAHDEVEEYDNDGHFVGAWGAYGSGSGEFYGPGGVAVDAVGNVFVVDTQQYTAGVKDARIEKFACP